MGGRPRALRDRGRRDLPRDTRPDDPDASPVLGDERNRPALRYVDPSVSMTMASANARPAECSASAASNTARCPPPTPSSQAVIRSGSSRSR